MKEAVCHTYDMSTKPILSGMVRDLMRAPPISISDEGPVIEAAKLMERMEISSVIIRHEEEFIGVVTDRDIIDRAVSRGLVPTKVKVREVMSSPLITINEEASIEEAAKKMRDNQVRRLVVEGDHQKVGIIAESDTVRIDPELHFLIREQSKLEVRRTPVEPHEVVLAESCEECGNYSSRLGKIDGRWLCEECRE